MNPLLYASQIAYSSQEALMLTYHLATELKDKPGCYLETGVAAGAQIIAMAAAAPEKTIYAFDSFNGIPLPSNRDDQMPGITYLKPWEQKALPDPGKQKLESSGATVVAEDDFWNHVYSGLGKIYGDPINVKTVKGWFEETVQDFKEPIAFLRLDGDLYNSTFVCLLHLFPRLINGGVLLIDDYNLKGCRDAVHEYFELIGYLPAYIEKAGVCYLYK
jgi:O-methyltransferase